AGKAGSRKSLEAKSSSKKVERYVGSTVNRRRSGSPCPRDCIVSKATSSQYRLRKCDCGSPQNRIPLLCHDLWTVKPNDSNASWVGPRPGQLAIAPKRGCSSIYHN